MSTPVLDIPVFDADNHLYGYVHELAGLPDATIRNIMGGNLARLMNVEDKILR